MTRQTVVGQADLFTRRTRRVQPPAPELHLQIAIADVLRRWCLATWKWSHFPAGEHRTHATAIKLKRMGVQPGWPDFILVDPKGIVHFLELKRRGGELSEAQREFQAWCHTWNVPHFVTDDFSDGLAVLKKWGALRVTIST